MPTTTYSAFSLGGCMPIDDQPHAAEHAQHGQRAIPAAQLPRAHLRPPAAVGDQSQRGRQHIGDVEEDHAHGGDGGVDRRVDREQHRRRRPRSRSPPAACGTSGDTCRSSREAGRPPSRAKANAIREAEVTVARPHRYWASTAMPRSSSVASQLRAGRPAASMHERLVALPGRRVRVGHRQHDGATASPSRRRRRPAPSGRCRAARSRRRRPSPRRRGPRRRSR